MAQSGLSRSRSRSLLQQTLNPPLIAVLRPAHHRPPQFCCPRSRRPSLASVGRLIEPMGRRKIFNTVHLPSGASCQGRSSNNLCTREFLEKKYDDAVSEIRFTISYADIISYHIDRVKRLFEE
jgi:hypothetical protein